MPTPDLMGLTDGWLTDWRQEGGRFKEWVRHLHLGAINDGWVRTLSKEPGRWLRRIGHVLSWAPHLWDDYDFDHSYIWRIMREKVRRMEKHQRGERLIGDWEKVADELHVADLVLTRLINDEYARPDWDEHFRRWPLNFDKRPSPEGRADLKRIHDREWASKRGDAEFLGRYMARKIWGWWS